MLDAYRTQPTSPFSDTGLRMSPAGVLVERDLRREAGWSAPHWTVLRVPAGDCQHRLGQHLTDAAVGAWPTLVREVRS